MILVNLMTLYVLSNNNDNKIFIQSMYLNIINMFPTCVEKRNNLIIAHIIFKERKKKERNPRVRSCDILSSRRGFLSARILTKRVFTRRVLADMRFNHIYKAIHFCVCKEGSRKEEIRLSPINIKK